MFFILNYARRFWRFCAPGTIHFQPTLTLFQRLLREVTVRRGSQQIGDWLPWEPLPPRCKERESWMPPSAFCTLVVLFCFWPWPSSSPSWQAQVRHVPLSSDLTASPRPCTVCSSLVSGRQGLSFSLLPPRLAVPLLCSPPASVGSCLCLRQLDFFALCLSLSISRSLSLCLSVSLCFPLSLSVPLSLCPLSLYHSVSFSASFCVVLSYSVMSDPLQPHGL